METLRVFSGDSHVLEPADLWSERLDRKYRDKAPRVVKNDNGAGVLFVAPDILPSTVAAFAAIGKNGKELQEFMGAGYESFRPGGWDPAERIKDQEIDGVEGEVLYSTLGMPLFGLWDTELQQACFRVYNDWLAQFCSYSPKRFVGIGLIPLDDIDEAIKELGRCRKIGLAGGMIWGSPPEDKPYNSPIYDRFWQAAAELRMPLALHIVTNKGKRITDTDRQRYLNSLNRGSLFLNGYQFATVDIQRSFFTFCVSGVLARFPGLILVSAENDVGWFVHFMQRMDHAYEKYGKMAESEFGALLPEPPSFYMRRQVYATFQDDKVGAANYGFFGADNFMWASDFPHSDSTWPNSREVIARDFEGVPEQVMRKIVFDNAIRLYGL
jgi:predicted TIM-barrel fold metal-dependent hydrolase